MLKINKITIQNFRGISSQLELNFEKGGRKTSIALYGKNGSGKSSIVDAWEWFYNSRISHLAREDAGEKDYPHKLSKGKNCYIDIEFEHEQINNVKVEFNPLRITQQVISGYYSEFKKNVPHPCHLRYRDLQQFVYFTKAQKYEFLAKYLGFDYALRIQNELTTFNNNLEREIQDLDKSIKDNREKIKKVIGEVILNDSAIMLFINSFSEKYHFEEIKKLSSIPLAIEKINDLIKEDPKIKELTECKDFLKLLNSFFPLPSIKEDSNKLDNVFSELKQDESNIKNIEFLSLYESGRKILEKSENKNICPLCDTPFEGDLLEHIQEKHSLLEKIKELKKNLEDLQNSLKYSIRSIQRKTENIISFESEYIQDIIKDFCVKIKLINKLIPKAIAILEHDLINLESLEFSKQNLIKLIDDIISQEDEIKSKLIEKKRELELDDSRKKLADDYSDIKNIFDEYHQYSVKHEKLKILNNIKSEFDIIFEKFKEWIKSEIQTAFDKINSDVIGYFNILEKDNKFLKNPQIKLISEKNKGVELEIEFVGEKLSPAYRVLSESQINSFGLSIFLASIKNFNQLFKFIILDDVVNSFDAFKRPRIVELINKHFSDYQFLLLTHDKIFFDRLQKSFPQWNRLNFYGWDYSTGPKIEVSKNIFEEIDYNLERDKAINAGQSLGRYLEWILQEINQNIETPIKFRIDNQHTLIELFEPMKKRFKDKLKLSGKIHQLNMLLEDFYSQTSFRNFCMHWKNTESEITSEEIRDIFEKWKEIESLIYCDECKSFVLYGSTNQLLRCNCNTIDLKEDKYFVVQNTS
ncbi:MAG: AAA family ATPase [Candidatus Helarchaeota archaeon]